MGLFVGEPRQMNIMLTEEDFKCLVRGGVLTVNSQLKLALEDIGFNRMFDVLNSAVSGIDIQKPRDRENEQ